jgi:hypothetical protein
MSPVDCPEVDEITWGDARAASEHYRGCRSLCIQRIGDLKTTINGRWNWMREQKTEVDADNQSIIDRVQE